MFCLNQITLNGTNRTRLDNMTLTIPHGRTAIVGLSGAGKTSLLNILAGFESPDSGTLTQSQSGRIDRLSIYWVPQNGGLWPHLTVEQHLECVNKVRKSTDEIVESMGLANRRSAFPGELSQGERSRLALARALATRAEVLLMDEPLSHVDPVRKPVYWKSVERLLEKDQISVIFSSHEPEIVLRHSDQVICLHEGRVAFQGATRDLYNFPPGSFVGEFLGPVNWFESEEAVMLSENHDRQQSAFGVRPERLILSLDPSSPLELTAVTYSGAYVESVVTHVESRKIRTILHQTVGEMPQPGQRIGLRMLKPATQSPAACR